MACWTKAWVSERKRNRTPAAVMKVTRLSKQSKFDTVWWAGVGRSVCVFYFLFIFYFYRPVWGPHGWGTTEFSVFPSFFITVFLRCWQKSWRGICFTFMEPIRFKTIVIIVTVATVTPVAYATPETFGNAEDRVLVWRLRARVSV